MANVAWALQAVRSLVILSWCVPQIASRECRHGVWENTSQKCKCFDGWGTAGITDTVDFLEGVCEQYHCQSDQLCSDLLGFEATCPKPGWNCYCGWHWALQAGGHGFETQNKTHGAECMGIMYTFSVWATEGLWRIMCFLWKCFGIAALVMFPFGRKRTICDHHWPSIWNSARRCLNCAPTCNGECVLSSTYTLDIFKDDLAWSLYVLDIGVWSYLLLVVLYIMVFGIWCILLWIGVLIIILGALCGLCCVALGGGGGGDISCDCACDHGLCGGNSIDGLTAEGNLDAGGTDLLYWYGPWTHSATDNYMLLNGPTMGPTEGTCCCCDCCSRQVCGGPIGYLMFRFPVMPENMWGGCLGLLMGTHHFTPTQRMYTGGNSFVEFLRFGCLRRRDLHANEEWRARVRDFVMGSTVSPQPTLTRRFTQGSVNEQVTTQTMNVHGQDLEVYQVGRAHATVIDREFDEDRDRCWSHNFEDYKKNECWICCSSHDNWDLWLSCHHMFCQNCSTRMLQARLPCPLCRVASSNVLRGKKWVSGGQRIP